MVGEIIIVVVRTLFRLIRDYDTRAWPTVQGVVETSEVSGSTAEVSYAYSINEESHWGVHRRDFCFHDSAAEYAKRFVPKWSLMIRYCEKDPHKSFVSESDQVNPPAWAMRYRD